MNDDFYAWRRLSMMETRCEMAIINLSGIVEEIELTRFLISTSDIPHSTDSMDTASGILHAVKKELESISHSARKERMRRQAKTCDALEDNE